MKSSNSVCMYLLWWWHNDTWFLAPAKAVESTHFQRHRLWIRFWFRLLFRLRFRHWLRLWPFAARHFVASEQSLKTRQYHWAHVLGSERAMFHLGGGGGGYRDQFRFRYARCSGRDLCLLVTPYLSTQRPLSVSAFCPHIREGDLDLSWVANKGAPAAAAAATAVRLAPLSARRLRRRRW